MDGKPVRVRTTPLVHSKSAYYKSRPHQEDLLVVGVNVYEYEDEDDEFESQTALESCSPSNVLIPASTNRKFLNDCNMIVFVEYN